MIDPEIARTIVDHVADQLEALEPDASDDWAGGDWRVGRNSRHTQRIYDRALELLPAFVRDAYDQVTRQ